MHSTVPDAQLFGDSEFAVRDQMLKLVAHAYTTRLAQKNGYVRSGTVESACKTVVGQRLKRAGMHWGEPGAHEVCHVRA